MIDAIYGSKLYRASKRKDKIHAAFMHKSNSELVTQLKSYLDEPYQKYAEPARLEPDVEPTDPIADDTGDGGEPNGGGSKGGHSAPSHHAGGGGSFSMPDSLDPGFDEDFNPADNLVTVDDDDEIPEVADTPESEEPVEESENVYGSTNVAERADVIKGTLNGREDTKGVARIHVKDNEMWIYYSDDTNLNNIMTAVIEYLNASGYTDLEFNRLARSDNAIVFVINDVTEPIKAIEPVEEDKKE